MGITYLNNSIEKIFKFRQMQLVDFKAIVVDGSNVCHQLYLTHQCDWKLGGEYPQFYSKVKEFFEELLKAKVKPIVVFDGIPDEKIEKPAFLKKEKNADLLRFQQGKRTEGKEFFVAPVLMLQTFASAVRDLDIEIHVATCDADNLIAAIANSKSDPCPVLADDSDYFIFELKHGYLPFKHFSSTSCSLYHTEMFQEQLQFKNSKLRLFIPAIHGNEFLESVKLPENDCIATTIENLKNITSYEEYITSLPPRCRDAVRTNLKKAEEQYCNIKSLDNIELQFKEFFDSKIMEVPQCVRENYRKGCFSPSVLNLMKSPRYTLHHIVEDIEGKESVWLHSRYIRKFLYGLMGRPETENVIEYIRKKKSTEREEQEMKPRNLHLGEDPSSTKSITVQSIVDYTEKEREDLVLRVLKGHKLDKYRRIQFDDPEDLVPTEWKLPLAATFYWYQSRSISKHLVKSLLLCFLRCSKTVQVGPSSIVIPDDPDRFCLDNLNSLHAFSQWQCVYYDAISLNYLANSPFYTTSPSSLYSGEVAMFYASCTPKELDIFSSGNCFFDLLFDIIIDKQKKSEN